MVYSHQRIINELESETEEMADHAFISVQNIKLKVLLDYIKDLEQRREINA